MSREILFRGKRVDNNQWTEGFLSFIYTDGRNSNGFIYTDKAQIYSPVEVRLHDVYTATVGQYTGLCDKHGVRIFEGDKVESSCGEIGIIEYLEEDGMFIISFPITSGHSSWIATFGDFEGNEMAVIGNIYDKEEQDALQGKFAQDGRCTFDE